jgi:hypothetical protein
MAIKKKIGRPKGMREAAFKIDTNKVSTRGMTKIEKQRNVESKQLYAKITRPDGTVIPISRGGAMRVRKVTISKGKSTNKLSKRKIK